ncbi:ATP synthase gamma chain [Bartonella henselae]|uniref:ATP synthase gamma chain n=2 Tax=Bartonella TaxID=773 RepID=ATPG_BARHE|nr:F0F1 ATP synthase subunit gamma [Bartonella henselae]Q6G1W8.1 RecName: Full=ATP synthase gamma chain; AltName: Full=ATP synthase F1 sector gamma subunit; AltName: Full=F-ATPase gamma subunit [Bartonella henselae str. Houston-1]ATP12956.1 ATP synthase subunit gamma [Bartonella henselae]ETS04961.1 ATP synthase gamma chain [Bartonella henselae JK 50]ETS05880.1 ATP synthase gamma chain [Bartonella henselae JK 51]MDM9990831.1 F0F1 ATP synthase subunit gamma [Bartonella henselae]OLL38064.1 ATP s
MASLKDLRDRIASVKATQKITKAMQMVAAARLHRAQEAAHSARPYAKRMAAILANLANDVDPIDAPSLMRGTGRDDVHLLVVCTAERGLCGAFNVQIARRAREHIKTLLAAGKIVKVLTVGKKGADILSRDYKALMIDHIDLQSIKRVGFAEAAMISQKIVDLFDDDAFDVCTLFYSEFVSVINQRPVAFGLVPMVSSGGAVETAEVEQKIDNSADLQSIVYDYEPDAASLLDVLVPRNLSVQIFRALLENVAGEMGAKMTAMDNASRNAGEMINKLTVAYNRQRQAQITTELIEIIAGAEAL